MIESPGAVRRAATCALAAVLVAACTSVPPLRRYLAQVQPQPIVVEGAHGPLTHAQGEKILAQLRKRSPGSTLLDRHVAIEQALSGAPLSIGNHVTLLEDGDKTYKAMLDAIAAARDSVNLEVYIFEGGKVGRAFADALIARCAAGVQVRVIYDSVGSLDTPKEFFERMRAAGVKVVAYNPVSPADVLKKGVELDHRDHRKLMVVDGRVAFLGGVNISKVYGALQRGPAGSTPSGGSASGSASGSGAGEAGPGGVDSGKPPWRDTQVRVEGPVVAELQRIFLAQWARERKQAPLTDKRFFPALGNAGTEVVRPIAASPDTGANALYVGIISAIENAETEVRIMNAYFVPHDLLLAALESAARRGVEVKLILPSMSDSALTLHATRSYYSELLEAGVKIYERKNRPLHAKTATIDGVWSTVGSTNLDWRSLVHNDELNIVVLSPVFAAAMNRDFDDDIANSRRITPEAWARRSLPERLNELLGRLSALLL